MIPITANTTLNRRNLMRSSIKTLPFALCAWIVSNSENTVQKFNFISNGEKGQFCIVAFATTNEFLLIFRNIFIGLFSHFHAIPVKVLRANETTQIFLYTKLCTQSAR